MDYVLLLLFIIGAVLAIRNTFRVDDLEKDIEETKGLIDENFEIIEDDLKDFTETMESMSNVDDEMIDTVGTINENHRMIADILENIILRVKRLERDNRCDEPIGFNICVPEFFEDEPEQSKSKRGRPAGKKAKKPVKKTCSGWTKCPKKRGRPAKK